MPDFISLAERAALLAVVDSEVPPGIEAVWLTGSRTRGQARQGSDWDVLVIHPDAPDDEYRVLAAGSFTRPGPDGNLINGFYGTAAAARYRSAPVFCGLPTIRN
jgi:hypothetical protein